MTSHGLSACHPVVINVYCAKGPLRNLVQHRIPRPMAGSGSQEALGRPEVGVAASSGDAAMLRCWTRFEQRRLGRGWAVPKVPTKRGHTAVSEGGSVILGGTRNLCFQ